MSVTAAGIAGTGIVSAQSQVTQSSSLVDKIASTFNLNKSEVQKVFDENRQEKETQHQQQFKEKLDQAVKEGKLTQDQETKLLAKLDELRKFRESLKDKSMSERKDAMKTKMEEFKKWLTDNKIPSEYAPMGGHGPHGHHGPQGQTESDNDTQ